MQSTKKVESYQAERIRPDMLLVLMLIVLLNKTYSFDLSRHNRSLILHKQLPKFTPVVRPVHTPHSNATVAGRHTVRH
jgi:hypothetical protein